MAVDRWSRISLIYKNETRRSCRQPREAGRPIAGVQRDPARIAPGADHPQSPPRLRQVRQRRRASDVSPDGELPGRTDATDQPPQGDGARGASLAGQLSGTEGSDRGDLRTQSRTAAAGDN